MKNLKTLKQISVKYGIPINTMYYYTAKKRFPVYKPTGGTVWICEEDIIEFLTSNRIPSASEDLIGEAV